MAYILMCCTVLLPNLAALFSAEVIFMVNMTEYPVTYQNYYHTSSFVSKNYVPKLNTIDWENFSVKKLCMAYTSCN